MRNTRWLILAPALIFALSSVQANATAQSGLHAVGYTITDTPPTRSDDAYTVCGSTIYQQINWTWDYEQNHLGDCGWDSFMVHYSGQIELPTGTTSVRFAVASDDGGIVDIGGNEFGVWWDQGCSITYSDRIEMTDSAPIDAWMYENGGGTCFMLFWQLNADNADWEIVPTWAFTTEYTAPTTTTSTTAPTETVPATTTTSTTVPETTTSSSIQANTSTAEQETTTPTTTSTTTTTTPTTTTTTTTTSTTTTTTPTTTTTSTTTTTTTTTSTTTTTTTEPPSVYTPPPATSTTQPEEVQPPTTEPEPVTTEPAKSPAEEQPQPEQTDTVVDRSPETSLPEPTPTVDEPTVELDIAEVDTPEEQTQQVSAELEQDTPITQEQALTVATSAAVLATISQEQAEQVFDALNVDELTDSQAVALVEAVQQAPTEVRQAFEQQINVFGGKFDSYVPVGSSVPVSVRRTLVAAAATLSAVAAPTRRSR